MAYSLESVGESPDMATDPLTELISLLRPSRVMGKGISGAGRWGVRYSAFGQPGFCIVTHGACLLQIEQTKPVRLEAGDIFYAGIGTEHVAHPKGEARILVIEKEGSI